MQESRRKQRLLAVATIIGTFIVALGLVQVLLAQSSPVAQPDGTPEPLTPEQMFQRYLDAHIIAPDVIDLSESEKTVNKAEAKAGDTLNYTILLHNGGDEPAIVTITDTLPTEISYVAGSLASDGGGTFSEDGGVISWFGAVNDGSDVTVTFAAVINEGVAVDTVITNTVEIAADTEMLTRTAVTTVVANTTPDRTTTYLPVVRTSLSTPSISVSRPNSQNRWTVSWTASPSATGYELQESHTPNFANPTILTVGTVSRDFQPAASPNNVYYYRVRSIDSVAGNASDWSSTVEVVGGYHDEFDDDDTGWLRRRLSHIDLVKAWYEIFPSSDTDWYIFQVDDKWDWGIASPLARAPKVPYVIEYDAKLVNPGNLTSYGIVFGGDLTDADCPNPNPPTDTDGWYKHDKCFNHFYTINTIYFGDTKLLFERVDRVVWCPDDPNCSGGGSPLKRGADTKVIERVSNIQTKDWNTWRVEVRESGIQVFVNGSHVVTYDEDDSGSALQWINDPYFGVFGSTDEYKPATGRFENFTIMPLDN